MPSSFFTKQQLSNWYLKEGLSTYQISEICGCDAKTVYYWLKLFQVPTRPRKIVTIEKDRLELHYDQGLSMSEIAKKFDCNAVSVFNKMKKYKIRSRKIWESKIIHKRENFSGDKIEKAYLIGFRIGDLNVVQKQPSKLIYVKSSTTRKEQLDLKNPYLLNMAQFGSVDLKI